jgi:hypothetical protein
VRRLRHNLKYPRFPLRKICTSTETSTKGLEVEDLPITILQRFDEIYKTLSDESERIAIPGRELMIELIKRCSFRMFDESDDYISSERAQNYPHYISPTFGNHAFRVYFNSFSSKIYIDLNREPIQAIRITRETEAQVLCEIIRSIVLVDPTL